MSRKKIGYDSGHRNFLEGNLLKTLKGLERTVQSEDFVAIGNLPDRQMGHICVMI